MYYPPSGFFKKGLNKHFNHYLSTYLTQLKTKCYFSQNFNLAFGFCDFYDTSFIRHFTKYFEAPIKNSAVVVLLENSLRLNW